MKPKMGQKMKLRIIVPCLAVSLAACTNAYPPRDTSAIDKINQQLKETLAPKEKATESMLPEAVSNSLLPPLRRITPKISSKQLEQRFDLVVKDAPVNQVFMGIISDTPYSIMVKPKNVLAQSPLPSGSSAGAAVALDSMGLTDKVTVNLKNVTMFEALDAIREVYGYDYTVEDYRIYVQQPEVQTRLFQVNYVLGQRRGVSDLQVIGGASTASSSSGSSSSTTSGGSSGGSYSSIQASALSTITKSDIWGEVQDALRTTLGCQVSRESPIARAGSAGGGRADVSYVGEMQTGERQRGADGCTDGRAMTVNPMSGTILVRAMPHELRTVEKMLRTMQLNIERQVIIEAKIIDVELNSGSQQGINWAGFQNNLHRMSVGSNIQAIDGTTATNGGAINTGTSLGGLLGTVGTTGANSYGSGNAFSAGVGIALQLRNFSALINFLQTQGTVHVLSSPRISTLNNQKAVIKVGTEEPYVSSISSQQTQTVAGGTSTTTLPTLNYQPFFSGIALDVTPQIDDKDNITLHVHSMVNSISEKYKVAQLGSSGTVPFAVNTINETDSVVKTKDGQVIVIGGLMTESTQDSRAGVPGLGSIPILGSLFKEGAQRSVKRELVILLRPTEVKDSSDWEADIAGVTSRIEALSAPPKSKTEQPAEKPAAENK